MAPTNDSDPQLVDEQPDLKTEPQSTPEETAPFETANEAEPSNASTDTDASPKDNGQPPKKHFWKRLKRWRPTRKQLIIFGAFFVILAGLVSLPLTRNLILGTVFKTSATIEVYDEFKDDASEQNQRIQLSDVVIKVDGKEVVKNGTSPIKLERLRPGKRTITISKTNYRDETLMLQANLAFGRQKNSASKKMTATGRQAKVLVTNFVSDEPIGEVTVRYKSSTAKTDNRGEAIITVPIESTNSYELKLSKDGYNDSTQKVTINAKPSTKAQTVHITPVGKVYFLSRASGKIDVVKSNLDGSARETVLSGTGRENDATTTMISTTDWRYLALSTHREDKKSQIIIIDTTTDTATTADEGNANFTLYGWDGHKLVFTSENNDTPAWQTGKNRLKNYDADAKKLAIIYQTVASGTNDTDTQSESIASVSIVNHRVLYQVVNYTTNTTSKFMSATISNNSQKTLFSYKSNELSVSLTYTSAKEAYYTGYAYTNNKYTYYEVGEDTSWKTLDKLPADTNQYTYFVSPDGQRLLWSEERDGKQTVLLGNSEAENPQKLYSLSELKPYAWFTDKYVLYTKKDSELYIAPIKVNGAPKKVTDYHRPRGVSFRGYGGGGGGPY